MNTITLANLKENINFGSDLLLDQAFVVLPATVPVTKELIATLQDYGCEELFINANAALPTTAPAETKIGAPKQKAPVPSDDFPIQIQQAINNTQITFEKNKSSDVRMAAISATVEFFMRYIHYVYTRYATHGEINRKQLTELLQLLCTFVKDYRRYILRLKLAENPDGKNFLIIHSLRSTIIAVIIGQQLDMPPVRQTDLALTCVLHEIGMIRIPPQVYLTDRQLTATEYAQLTTHAVVGYNILKDLGFPLSVQLGVLEHHEKENGTGYPRHLTGDKISSYAKIISVACAFEAITAPRAYRDDRSPFEAMLELLKNNQNQYDENVVKALLAALSLYPIGTYVFLKNGKIGYVVDVSPNNPAKPYITLIGQKNSDTDSPAVQIDDDNNKVMRVLSKKEVEDVLRSIEQNPTPN